MSFFIVIFLRKGSPLKIMLLFGLKRSHSPDIQIFVNTLHSHFSIVSHCKDDQKQMMTIISKIKKHNEK